MQCAVTFLIHWIIKHFILFEVRHLTKNLKENLLLNEFNLIEQNVTLAFNVTCCFGPLPLDF